MDVDRSSTLDERRANHGPGDGSSIPCRREEREMKGAPSHTVEPVDPLPSARVDGDGKGWRGMFTRRLRAKLAIPAVVLIGSTGLITDPAAAQPRPEPTANPWQMRHWPQ